MIADDGLICGQDDVVLLELLCTEVSVDPIISDVSKRSRDTVLVYLRLPV